METVWYTNNSKLKCNKAMTNEPKVAPAHTVLVVSEPVSAMVSEPVSAKVSEPVSAMVSVQQQQLLLPLIG